MPSIKFPWVLLTSEDLPRVEPDTSTPPMNPSLVSDNRFNGYGPEAINDFVRKHEQELVSIRLYCTNWVIIDQLGIETDTCLVVDQIFDPIGSLDEDIPISLDGYLYNSRAARAPFIYVVDMLNSLTKGESTLGDWVRLSHGVQPDGSYIWAGQPENKDRRAKRELGSLAALSAMADYGHYSPPGHAS